MGDTTLSTRRTAGILKQLDHAAKSVGEARHELIQAMAERKRSADSGHQVRPPAARSASRRKHR